MARVIGISGASGSGKSTLSRAVVSRLNDCYYLSADKFYKKELPKIISPLDGKTYDDWNHPTSIDSKALVEELLSIKNDYSYIVIDGAFIFCIPEILKLLDYKIFVDASIEMRIFRRISRNVVEKKQSIEFIGGYYLSCARYREKEFSLVSRKYADLIVDNENSFDDKLEELIEKIK